MFSFNERVHTEQFEAVLKKGRMFHSPLFSISFLKADNKGFSVVASKKVSKKATIRNKNKRRVRHIMKKLVENVGPGLYIVFIKKDLSSVTYPLLEEELKTLAQRLS